MGDKQKHCRTKDHIATIPMPADLFVYGSMPAWIFRFYDWNIRILQLGRMRIVNNSDEFWKSEQLQKKAE